mgnify:CR=1 FL=1
METFFVALSAVAVMLLYAVPGFILVKTKAIKPDSIPAFAKALMYVCQPCLTIYSFSRIEFSRELFSEMAVFFLIVVVFLSVLLAAAFGIIFRKRRQITFRVCALASCFGNCAFMGIPLLEAIFPDEPATVTFSAVFFFVMSLMSWTVGSAIITLDVRYVNIRKIILNPSFLSILVALLIFVTGFEIPPMLDNMITLLGRMSTPMCMLVMGMRLATVSVRNMICRPIHWLTIAVKQLLAPVIALVLISFVPVDPMTRSTFVVLAACPVASVVLNFAEMLGQGQETAADLVLLGTLSSVLTIPIITLLL